MLLENCRQLGDFVATPGDFPGPVGNATCQKQLTTFPGLWENVGADSKTF